MNLKSVLRCDLELKKSLSEFTEGYNICSFESTVLFLYALFYKMEAKMIISLFHYTVMLILVIVIKKNNNDLTHP